MLLVLAVSAILTGIVAQLWDLNDFRYHTWAGYAMAAAALVHVWLNWRQVMTYTQFRLGRRAKPGPRPVRQREPVAAGQIARGVVLSRRGLLGLTIDGLGGLVPGAGLRPAPALSASSDVGLVHHEWSKPGLRDAVGTLMDWGVQPLLYAGGNFPSPGVSDETMAPLE